MADVTDVPRLRDFACNCDPEDKAVWDALRAEVCAALECEPYQLVTAVVKDLMWTYDVTIEAVPTDMWSAVMSEYRNPQWEVEATAYIECDLIEDGFALTWKTWKEWTEKKKKKDA